MGQLDRRTDGHRRTPDRYKYLALLKADSASLTSNYTNIVHFALGAKFIAESLTYL